MNEPYTPQMIARLLRQKSDAELRVTRPAAFHLWPARKIVPSAVIADLIQNETRRRA